jgi:RNA polymerase sigma-70 factor (ECF subfamily)
MPTQNPVPPAAGHTPRLLPSYAERAWHTAVAGARPRPGKILPTERGIDLPQPTLHDAMLSAVPKLRAYASSLARNADRADDLVQETLLRAITKIELFRPGSNMNAWLFTILRNLFLSECRKRRREVEDPDGTYVASLVSQPAQESRMAIVELSAALESLPPRSREALIFVGGWGFRQCEVATVCGTTVGTIKSRVHRARKQLAQKHFLDPGAPFADRSNCIAQN